MEKSNNIARQNRSLRESEFIEPAFSSVDHNDYEIKPLRLTSRKKTKLVAFIIVFIVGGLTVKGIEYIQSHLNLDGFSNVISGDHPQKELLNNQDCIFRDDVLGKRIVDCIGVADLNVDSKDGELMALHKAKWFALGEAVAYFGRANDSKSMDTFMKNYKISSAQKDAENNKVIVKLEAVMD